MSVYANFSVRARMGQDGVVQGCVLEGSRYCKDILLTEGDRTPLIPYPSVSASKLWASVPGDARVLRDTRDSTRSRCRSTPRVQSLAPACTHGSAVRTGIQCSGTTRDDTCTLLGMYRRLRPRPACLAAGIARAQTGRRTAR